MLAKLEKRFDELFGPEGEKRAYFAPGRVNLIGEHTDYNGGHVFPCALTMGSYAVVRGRKDRSLNFYSMNFDGKGVFRTSLDDLVPAKAASWTNYPKGVIWTFEQRGFKLDHGFDMAIYGDIPAGSGLSSSAALEVLTGLVVKDLFGFDVSMQDIALIGQYAENNFNGMNCGIMDQFASAMGKKDCAIFLDTATLNYEYAPVVLDDARIVIVNSKVKHSLVDSAYNDRRKESGAALADLQKVVDIKTLGDLDEEQFEKYKDAISDPVARKRGKHAVYENQRTIHAIEALKKGDLATFGKLINESHISLRDDYEVSCPEVDFLVETAWKTPGVIGSRITGGGFGGCTVNLVRKDAVDSFVETVAESYKKEKGLNAECYIVDVGEGAHRIY